MAARGLSEVVIMPCLLGHGKHATEELEDVLDDAQVRTPQVQLRLSAGPGADPRLADLVVERVRDLDGIPDLTPDCGRIVGVLMVKAGTKTQYDDCVWLSELGQMVERQLGPGFAVDVGQSHCHCRRGRREPSRGLSQNQNWNSPQVRVNAQKLRAESLTPRGRYIRLPFSTLTTGAAIAGQPSTAMTYICSVALCGWSGFERNTPPVHPKRRPISPEDGPGLRLEPAR